MKFKQIIIIILFFTVFLNTDSFACEEDNCNHYKAIKCINPINNPKKHKEIQEQLLEEGVRPDRQHFIISKSGIFKIHYDTVGEHKVDLTDNNKNNIPDYVDSTADYFDYSYKVQVSDLGYLAPLKDTLGGSDHFDIYITQLCSEGNAIYGFTGLDYETSINDTLIKGVCYIYVDNDYSEKDSVIVGNGKYAPAFFSRGYEGLKITVSHEFHHAIQFTYGYTVISSHSLNEMYSTYMERVLYPEIKDYYQYVNDLMTYPQDYPFGLGNGQVGYRWSIFAEYMDKIGGNKLLKSLWEIIGNENDGYTALDSAFIKQGSSLNQSWFDFFDYVYFTGNRSQGDKYLNNANELRKISPSVTLNLNLDNQSKSGSLFPYQIESISAFFDDEQTGNRVQLDFIFSNFDLVSAQKQELGSVDYNITFSNTSKIGYEKVADYDIYYKLSDTNNLVRAKYYINGGLIPSNEVYVFPQPFSINNNNDISFVVKSEQTNEKNADLQLFNTDLIQVYSDNIEIGTKFGRKTITIKKDKFTNLKTGIYFYNLSIDGANFFGKFSIID